MNELSEIAKKHNAADPRNQIIAEYNDGKKECIRCGYLSNKYVLNQGKWCGECYIKVIFGK